MSNTEYVTVNLGGKQVQALVDGDKLIIEVAGRKVRIPMDAKGVLSVPRQGRVTLESAPPEPTEAVIHATKLRAVREAAKRPATPKNQRESYLRARHAAAVRDAHTMGFRCGFAEGQSKLLGAPLADRVTDADGDQLIERVMQIVLDSEELRAGYRMACALVDGDNVGSADVVAPVEPAPVEEDALTGDYEEDVTASTVAAIRNEPTIQDLIDSIDREVGTPVSFSEAAPVVPAPVFVPQEAAQGAVAPSEPKGPAKSLVNTVLNFGLTSMGVTVHNLHADHGVELHQAHSECGGRIHMPRTCSACSEKVASGDLGRVHTMVDGTKVMLDAEEYAALAAEGGKAIDIDSFINAEDLDPTLLATFYQLRPTKGAEKAYSVLAEALRSTGRIGMGRVVLRGSETLVAIQAIAGNLMLSRVRWADEVRETVDVTPANFSDAELGAAVELVGAMSTKFDHAALLDHTQVRLIEALNSKLAA